jgi:putative copper export protein
LHHLGQLAQDGANVPTLSDAWGGFRLILHVLAATVWVGGQFTVAGLLPTIRSLGEEAPKKVAVALGRLLWPAYAVLVVTGFWNIGSFSVDKADTAWKTVLIIKIVVVAIAGVAVFFHQRSTSRRGLAVWGAVGALASVGALGLGVFLAG